ncbi:hypothetical protein [Alicyclobacillus acidocaldarius]|uniref:TadE family protein n=1 Tax=Alicyclobacillus acidocaldarius subsp. acidocaldarius (strain ATCC 27009 / DSM 446 / BCRC 14685 / JCM 5260 / KCTC 1825 / NBRC 15652 / NCIMB 11725 / NRRL B-14509 / 104-IA) TaxID=521098 RepID=C8WVT9_ALIAD|nr:hypothetical protein [Alicyclobacillus acidocaldarius]ACV58211.1 hypothetical protein Aaci_1180 [Alicyclobacillus acidocaldarius subsp. acidocaldarius DSM 446]
MSAWRFRYAGTGVSLLYAGLVSTAAGLVVLGLLIIFTSLIHVRSVLVTAADNGARVAAITGDTQVAEQAVADTLTEAGLPQSYGGQSLWSMSSTTVTSGTADPEVQVTVHYNAPILFPDLFAALGHPNSLPLTIPLSVTASDVNEAYFTSS